MSRSFRVRGIVEGFYGRPWSHEARRSVLSFVAERGMNAYVYAPKDDPKHRSQWRVPYDPDELARFEALAAHATALGMRFGFAISPGLDVDYDLAEERATLRSKLRPLVDAGVTWVVLALDDIALVPGLATRQAGLATWLLDALHESRTDMHLTLVPTEYVGTTPTPYLASLAAGLPSEVDVMWTGPTVCPATLEARDARAWGEAMAGHGVLVWDNYPVNDGTMEGRLHLGPYRGREPALAEIVGGVLCNPMTQARASLVALATACDFLSDPDGYDPDAAWDRAIRDVGAGEAAPLAVLARACADGPSSAPGSLDMARRVAALARALEVDDAIDALDVNEALDALRDALRAARALPDAFPADASDDTLAAEVAPWAAAARDEAEAGRAAVRLVRAVLDGDDAETAMQHAFVLCMCWAHARRSTAVVYGPRFAIYPAVVRLPDGRTALDVDAGVLEDANAIDALCRLALGRYRAWCEAPRSAAEAPIA